LSYWGGFFEHLAPFGGHLVVKMLEKRNFVQVWEWSKNAKILNLADFWVEMRFWCVTLVGAVTFGTPTIPRVESGIIVTGRPRRIV
jgi:hypothetical protein